MSNPTDGSDAAAELRQLRRRLREVERELEAREQEVAMLRSSHSFRVTAPLRWLRRCLTGGYEAPAPSLTARSSASRRQAEALVGLPSRVVAVREPSSDPNDSHRPLQLDGVVQPLLRVEVVRGQLARCGAPGATCYYGTGRPLLRLATVATRELRDELAFDAAVTPLQAQGWEEQLDAGSHDLLLIEGAWEPEGGWGAPFAATDASRAHLAGVLAKCREMALPAVLWAREDVGGLERLGWLVPQVDRAYALDAAGLAWMQREFPGVACGVLPPAVQPALHNPVRSYALRECEDDLGGKVLLDGWWELAGRVRKNPVAAALGERLRVVDSRWDYSWARLGDAGRFAGLALGAVTPLEKSALLRTMAAELFLPGSLTSPWRQANNMMRAAACGATVLWAGNEASPWSGARRVSASSATAVVDDLRADPLAVARSAHLAFRDVFNSHCISHRLARIASDLGLCAGVEKAPDPVAHLLVTMRPALLEACLRRFRADLYPRRELVVVLHGDDIDMAAARALLVPGEPVTLLQAGRERSLGDCLNMAIAHTGAPYWMKLDDDDHYGPAYTTDMMLYRRAVDAPLMGKPPMFLHLEQGDELRWDPVWASHANLLHHADEADAALVAGGTLAGKREVLEAVRFSAARRGGSDSDFIRRCHEQGHDLLAVDGFNFVRFRSASVDFHTWKVSDENLRGRTRVVGEGAAVTQQAYI